MPTFKTLASSDDGTKPTFCVDDPHRPNFNHDNINYGEHWKWNSFCDWTQTREVIGGHRTPTIFEKMKVIGNFVASKASPVKVATQMFVNEVFWVDSEKLTLERINWPSKSINPILKSRKENQWVQVSPSFKNLKFQPLLTTQNSRSVRQKWTTTNLAQQSHFPNVAELRLRMLTNNLSRFWHESSPYESIDDNDHGIKIICREHAKLHW